MNGLHGGNLRPQTRHRHTVRAMIGRIHDRRVGNTIPLNGVHRPSHARTSLAKELEKLGVFSQCLQPRKCIALTTKRRIFGTKLATFLPSQSSIARRQAGLDHVNFFGLVTDQNGVADVHRRHVHVAAAIAATIIAADG